MSAGPEFRRRAFKSPAGGAAVVLVGLCLVLAAWQMRRGDEQAALAERLAAVDALPVLQRPPEPGTAEAHLFRTVSVRGRYVSARQILLDGMTYKGRAGYHVLTPFRPQNSERWLLVNRGWVQADPDRRVLPQIDVGEEPRAVVGRISLLPRPGIRLGAPAVTQGAASAAAQVLLYPTAEELAALLPQPVFDYQLLLAASEPDGFTRDWQPPGLGAARHRAYALQWLAFAAVLVVMSYRFWRGSTREH